MPSYTYRITGTGRGAAPWWTTGRVETAQSGALAAVLAEALRVTYERLTDGTAHYGDLYSCQGPYTITRVQIDLEPHA